MIRINIAVASPSDVARERDSVIKEFTRWNDSHSEEFLHPVMWEHSSVPELGDHPQQILNERIIEKSELLVAIFWAKFGTPTQSAESGTEEEIREFIKRKGPSRVLLYFCKRDVPFDQIDSVQFERLKIFKQEMRTKGIYWEYSSVDEFGKLLYQHIDVKVDELINGELELPAHRPVAQLKEPNNILPADKRLHQLIDFGSSIEEISRRFLLRTKELSEIDGMHPDKFYDLAAHVYTSAALSIDKALNNKLVRMSATNMRYFERVSGQLKTLGSNIPSHKSEDFRTYFLQGKEIAEGLEAHVKLMGKWGL